MTPLRLKLIAALLLSGPLCAAPITQGVPGAVPPEQFRIMSEQEITEHKAAMASLQGTAREDYRNAQYRKLKERAQAQGYALPDTPPWGRTEVVPAPRPDEQAGSTPGTPAQRAGDMMQRLIEQQKQVVQQALQATEEMASSAPGMADPSALAVDAPAPEAEKAADQMAKVSPPAQAATPAATPVEAPAPTAAADPRATITTEQAQASPRATEAYRRQMRDRFDQFMQQREDREKERQAERDRKKSTVAERRQRYDDRVQRRRQAYRQRLQQPRQVPGQPAYPGPAPVMPQVTPGRPYPQQAYPAAPAYGYPPQIVYPPRY